MSFRKISIAVRSLPLLWLAAASGAACGNYSNEDLEFMSALPEKQDLSAVVPVRSALTLFETADYYRLTRNVSLIFNGISDGFLGLIDAIRAYPPTTRHPSERIWGPFPAEQQPGWMIQLVMNRTDLATFTYSLEFRAVGADPGSPSVPLITGRFAAVGGVRKGMGHIEVNTEPLRAAGVDPGLGFLDRLTIDYTTSAFPIDVSLTFTNFANPLKPDDPTSGSYTYSAQSNGQGALTYDFTGDTIPLTPALETWEVTSRWLGSGEGRADLQVLSGDAAGARSAECWNQQLRAVYIDKPWAPLEDIGTVADCPAIPTL